MARLLRWLVLTAACATVGKLVETVLKSRRCGCRAGLEHMGVVDGWSVGRSFFFFGGGGTTHWWLVDVDGTRARV